MYTSISIHLIPIKKFFYFFLKLDHFLRTFCKKCIFTIENPKKTQKNFQKMIKLLLDKQIFASSDAKFCRNTHNNGCYTQNFVHNTCNFSLDMVLSPQYVSKKPIHEKNFSLKLIFRTPPPIMEFSIIFLKKFLTLSLAVNIYFVLTCF